MILRAGLVVSGLALALAAGALLPAERALEPTSTLTAQRLGTSVSGAARATAAWCGAPSQVDRVPNVVAGNAVHWVYAIPADGADALTSLAPVMQADAEEIDAWWRRFDPVRAPRNDLAPFPCGQQLDITTLRLRQTSAQLAPLQGRFSSIVDAVEAAGLRSSFSKILVYYDGPVSEANVCGQGGTEFNGFGVAITYYRACTGVSTAAVSVHEVLHALGAVARGAPNECSGADRAHTCDNEDDLLYPRIGGEPLSAKLLDPGFDDYYGHAGGWLDVQDSPWLVRADSQQPLALTLSGRGSVTADVPGLACAASCTTTWNAGQRLVLTATPGPGARFVRWTGACTGTADCTLSVGSGTQVAALFAPPTFRLRVTIAGRGVVRSAGAGITCRPRCSASLPSFVPVRLTATPAKGWKLRSWSGACRGAERACTVPMSAAATARATFVRQ